MYVAVETLDIARMRLVDTEELLILDVFRLHPCDTGNIVLHTKKLT